VTRAGKTGMFLVSIRFPVVIEKISPMFECH
jgi:hypothetical protein